MKRETLLENEYRRRALSSSYRMAARWALIAVVLFPQAALAKPLAREILAETPFNQAQIQGVLAGKLVTSNVVEVSERELSAAVACLVPPGRKGSLEFARNNRVTMPDEYKDTAGPIDPEDIEGSIAALNLGGTSARPAAILRSSPASTSISPKRRLLFSVPSRLQRERNWRPSRRSSARCLRSGFARTVRGASMGSHPSRAEMKKRREGRRQATCAGRPMRLAVSAS